MATRKRKFSEADRRAAANVRALWVEYQKQNPGVSQEAAAALAGMTQSAFSQFVLGRVPMRVTPVLKFAKLFSVPPTKIRDDLAETRYSLVPKVTKLKTEEPLADAGAAEIASIFTRLTPQSKDLARELMFMIATVDKHFPWLRRGRPKADTYAKFEKWHETNIGTLVELAVARGQERGKGSAT